MYLIRQKQKFIKENNETNIVNIYKIIHCFLIFNR